MLSYMADKIPVDHTPTALDTFQVDIKVGDEVLTLDITDTAGQDGFERFKREKNIYQLISWYSFRLRKQNFVETDVYLACFSLLTRSSLGNHSDVSSGFVCLTWKIFLILTISYKNLLYLSWWVYRECRGQHYLKFLKLKKKKKLRRKLKHLFIFI